MRVFKRFVEEILIILIVLYVHWEVGMAEDTKKVMRIWLIAVFAVAVIRLLQGG